MSFKNYEKKELIEKELKLCCIDSLKRVKISCFTLSREIKSLLDLIGGDFYSETIWNLYCFILKLKKNYDFVKNHTCQNHNLSKIKFFFGFSKI